MYFLLAISPAERGEIVAILPELLRTVFDDFENRSESFSDYDIDAVISKAVKAHKGEGNEVTDELIAESIAFSFCEDYQNEQAGWGTYYGPMSVIAKGDKVYEHPSMQSLTPEILDYWQVRSKETIHPLLQNRYADLVWDFSQKIRCKAADISVAHTVIDSAIRYSNEKRYEHRVEAMHILNRAMSIALSINDQERVSNVIDAVLKFEEDCRNEDNDMAWGFAYDLFNRHKKIKLTDEQRQRITKGLEEVLDMVAYHDDEKNIDPFKAEDTAIRLAEFYRKQNRPDDIRRVLLLYANTFLCISKQANSMLAVTWLRKVYDNLTRFNIKDEADKIAAMMRERGANTKNEMAKISHKMEVSKEEIDKYLSEVLEGDADEASRRFITDFIPNPSEAERQLKDISKETVLWGLLSQVAVDENGREVCKIGSVQDDLEGRVVARMSQNMQVEAFFLNITLREWIKRFEITAESLTDLLMISLLYQEDRRTLLYKGIEAYLEGDYIAAVHILIPQIENALRQLLIVTGQNTYKPGRHGGLNLRILDDILRDQVVEQVFGSNSVKYLKVLLTDPRGWNIRNDICHGIRVITENNPMLIDRIIHVILMLSKVHDNEKEM